MVTSNITNLRFPVAKLAARLVTYSSKVDHFPDLTRIDYSIITTKHVSSDDNQREEEIFKETFVWKSITEKFTKQISKKYNNKLSFSLLTRYLHLNFHLVDDFGNKSAERFEKNDQMLSSNMVGPRLVLVLGEKNPAGKRSRNVRVVFSYALWSVDLRLWGWRAHAHRGMKYPSDRVR